MTRIFDESDEETVAEEYFNWLYSLVGQTTRAYSNYKNLMLCLYSIEFYWSVEHDENRELDGLELRNRFCEIYDLDIGEFEETFSKPCSVLEMMVALAFRIEDSLMWDPVKGNQTYRWFWEMVRNLGLTSDEFLDDNWDRDAYVKTVITVTKMLNRDYDYMGHGGLFPLKNPNCVDQTGIEIWYEMQNYYGEKLTVE